MRRARVAPIHHIHRPVGTGLTIDRTESDVIGFHQRSTKRAFPTRAVALEAVPVDGARKQIARDICALELFGQRGALIHDAAASHVAAFEAAHRHVFEVSVGMWIVQWPVLGETFYIIRALHLMQADLLTEIRSSNDLAFFVKIETPGVATTFAEQLELARDGVVTPDALLK